MHSISIIPTSHSLRAAVAPLASSKNRRANGTIKPRFVALSKPAAAEEEHFEPAEPRGECLLADARDAIEACKNLPPQDEAACMLALGCDAEAVHARLDTEDEEQAKKAAELAAKK